MANSKKKQPITNRISNIEHKFEIIQKAVDILRREQAEYYENFNERMNNLTIEINSLKDIVNSRNEVSLKNGNGRIIKMLKEEFYQMLYDKIQFKYFTGILGKMFSVILTMLLILNLIINIFFRK